MASKVVRPKNLVYPPIQRGASLTIPVTIKSDKEQPIDLTNTEIAFTLKALRSDYDMKDSRAFVTKNFAPQEPLVGKFFIQLSSEDLNFDTGEYYFDIEITKPDGAVYRICTLSTELVGGPTNRTINIKTGQLPVGDEITVVTLATGAPIVIVSNPVIISSAAIIKIDETMTRVEALELQVDQLTQSLNGIETTLDGTVRLLDSLVLQHAQTTTTLRQVSEDLITLTRRVDKLFP